MRVLTGTVTASMVLAGAALALAGPAFAEDSIYFNHAMGTMSGAAPAVEAPSAAADTPRRYMQVEPRDMRKGEAVSNADASNPYFDHAEGTMSTDAGTSVQSAQSSDGQYVAAYHQPYMQMDPRDAKKAPESGDDVDGSNIYFNHAMGTMSGN